MTHTCKNMAGSLGRSVIRSIVSLAVIVSPAIVHGQMPTGSDGLANRAVGRLTDLSQDGPGYLYYGVNAADRGLGYIGSYMTLGGFIPLAEDDLGGVWNADLRSHLSVYGGFFSNVGAVRKQLLGGGSLLGVGVYWDYDGDLNQYPTFGQPGALFGQFGHVYNQVGVSGEWLTDWGNLRSNGYIPVGQTGHQLVSNRSNGLFYQNFIIPQNGLDAALGGADLELGAYVPGLADWAGMINVGGYTFGNASYTKIGGSNDGGDLVPWFGGVYTRLDLTFARNWDFSLQYNNDSFFDSTGFARLTYRMGGSRRRNVPDQMEQPMFRNEHIVRAHETPLAALNPENTNQPWMVVHVDNSAFPGGDGTVERPFQSLTDAENSALVQNESWTITYLHLGNATTTLNAYTNPFQFQQANQFLVGSGGPLTIATQPIGSSSIFTVPATTTVNPILSNPAGTSVAISGTGGVTIANLNIIGSQSGITATGDLTGTPQPAGTTANPGNLQLAANGASSIRNVTISGDGTNAPQTGIELTNTLGDLEATDTIVENMTVQGLQVDGGSANVDYFGRITTNVADNGNVSAGNILVNIIDTTGGTLNIGSRTAPLSSTVANRLLDVGAEGIFIARNAPNTEINIGSATLVNNRDSAIFVENDNSSITVATMADPAAGYDVGIFKNTPGAVIAIEGGGPQFEFFGTINNTPPAIATRDLIQMSNLDAIASGRPAGSRTISINGPGLSPLQDGGNGVFINAVNNYESVDITGLAFTGTADNSILLQNSNNSSFTFNNTRITGPTGSAVLLQGLGGSTAVTFDSLDIALNNGGTVGIEYANSTNTGTVQFIETRITGATSQGVLLSNNSGTTTFDDLSINLTSGTAQGFNATNAGRIYTTGTNTIANASATLAAIYVEQTTDLTGPNGEGLDFLAVDSGNPNATPAEAAITIVGGTATGEINMGTFTVDGADGTTLNVNNTGNVTVTVSGTQISP